ncbi:MAG: phosphoenolpyruvate carboxylase, partial [Aeromonas sobria]
MNEKYAALRANVGMLGQLLGKSIKDHQGQAFLDKIETIRQLAKSSRKGNESDRERLLDTLRTLSDSELLPVARAFSQFLNLANVAEQFHTISRRCEEQVCTPDPLEQMFDKLKASNLSQEAIIQAVRELDIDLVLTAHPTEVTRRTLIHKHVQLNDCLEALELSDLLPRERDKILNRIEQLINQAWHTNEIREQRPTPVDEAKWGFAVVENSLWPAIPEFMRNLDERLQHHLGVRLPLDAAPVKFTSWMGGDRDGNPFVTAKVTAEVLELGRWMAVSLFYKDIKELTSELSMSDCTDAVRARVGDHPEPYRALVRELREALRETKEHLTAKVQGQVSESLDLVKTTAQLREPLELCYHSLHACGMGNIADGMLLDVLRKVACFGIHLVKLDIRQDGERHGLVFSELTRYLGLGDYAEWSEDDKQAFLLNELSSRRPLIPHDWEPSAEVRETLDTCQVIAQ